MRVVAAGTQEATPWVAATLRAGMWAAAHTLPDRAISRAAATWPRPIMAAGMRGVAQALLDMQVMPAAMGTRPVGAAGRGAAGAAPPGAAVLGAAAFGPAHSTAPDSPGSCPFCPWHMQRIGMAAFRTPMPTTSITPGTRPMTATLQPIRLQWLTPAVPVRLM